ncbi:predicted protein [Histoplasma mississippiense (nom. inval.)]|uniref:predicted protein n=1 Tax=Ajellomyces capsulatus (strain NAm1 / WU24) TaxID=2059318 RepID=UPI000157C7C2|nr:predicted protein [Histoplasma mississippiense (nom. inval.)]EDN08189.1 predicted protein [Histoplasma mississippiense (nom. inval.)]
MVKGLLEADDYVFACSWKEYGQGFQATAVLGKDEKTSRKSNADLHQKITELCD